MYVCGARDRSWTQAEIECVSWVYDSVYIVGSAGIRSYIAYIL